MRYEALELGFEDTDAVPVKRPSGKEPGLLLCPGCSVAHISIAKSFVWIEFGRMRQGQGAAVGSILWGPAFRRGPVNMSLPAPFDAVRVWRAVAAEEPQLTIAVD